MWMYALFNVAAWIFIWRKMPELTGRSLEQIESKLHHGEFTPKDFAHLPPDGKREAASSPA
jgi:hypothetical protein